MSFRLLHQIIKQGLKNKFISTKNRLAHLLLNTNRDAFKVQGNLCTRLNIAGKYLSIEKIVATALQSQHEGDDLFFHLENNQVKVNSLRLYRQAPDQDVVLELLPEGETRGVYSKKVAPSELQHEIQAAISSSNEAWYEKNEYVYQAWAD